MEEIALKFATRAAQAGNRQDPQTGAVSTPVYYSTTFAHPALGQSTGYDYGRSGNPTRTALEGVLADLEGGTHGFAFSSGMAAVSCALALFEPGDHVIASDDLYGGTYRLFETIAKRQGICVQYVDTGDAAAVAAAVTENTRGVFVETPTNPTMKIADLHAVIALAGRHALITIVDNTFMTPYLQQPLALGADIVLHSATKYLGGHNDVLAGALIVSSPALAERLSILQNSIGAVLGPQDAWLLLRGIKTLALRMDRHEHNAREIAKRLLAHPFVGRVYYPGLPAHPGRAIQERQAAGYGGMVAFEVVDEGLVAPLLSSVEMITFAESLGSVESLITFPSRQTHADIPPEIRALRGVTEQLLRLSVGIEDVEDIWTDLDRALRTAARMKGLA